MGQLKSAWELAMERTVVSPEEKRYKTIDQNEYYGYEQNDDLSIDFVKDWKHPDDKKQKLIENAIPIDLSEEEREGMNERAEEFFKRHDPEPEIDYEKGPKLMEVHWGGNFLDYGGFARLNRSMVFGLSDRNVVVKTEVQSYINDINEATRTRIQEMSKVKINPRAPKVVGVTMPMDISHTGYKIIYTMIETSNKIHKDYAEKLNLFNEIWVPSHYAKDMFIKSGVRSRIEIIPLGVDPTRYRPQESIMDFGQDLKAFKFLSVFKWSYRKGYDILLRAYLEEFSSQDDVSLLLMSRDLSNLKDSGVEKMIEDFQVVVRGVGKAEEDLPHVALYPEKVPERDMPKIYNACNCFVLISRGEGFCLPYCEAAACGLPVIGSNCTGQTEFLTHDNSYLIDPEDYQESNLTGSFTGMAKMSRFYEGQEFPVFGAEAIKETRKAMREVFEGSETVNQKAKKLRENVVKNFRWEQTLDKVFNRLQDIYEEQGL